MFLVVAELRNLNLLGGNRKSQQEPPVAKNTNPPSQNFTFSVDLRSWERSLLGLTLLAKPKAAELAGVGFTFLEWVLAKLTVGMVPLDRRQRTWKIENRTVLFDQELFLSNIEVTKLWHQCVDFFLLTGNHVELQLHRAVRAQAWVGRSYLRILIGVIYYSVLRTVVRLVVLLFDFFGCLITISNAAERISLGIPLSFYLKWVHFV
jgi:hypothetical protein